MKKLLVLTGVLATGKSTFAKILSEKFNVDFYTKDSIKENLADTIGFKNREENRKLSIMAVDQMINSFENYSKENKELILEANFRIGELERIKEIADKNKVEVLVLNFNGDNQILFDRFMYRINFEHRHPAHIIPSFTNLEGFIQAIKSYKVDNIPFDTIQINANDFSYQQDRNLLDKIETFLHS